MAEVTKQLTAYRNKLPKEEIANCIKKIMNTLPFRKLSEKTQVILSLSGPDVRTRLTHTIEVAKIARDICEELGLNAELAEAIAFAHDIGHTPFGHVGERTLREIMCGCDTLEGKLEDENFDNSGFKHNLQSFRVLNDLEILPKDDNEAWPYILWGAMDHTNMSYSKPYSGMENEIFISCRHCDWVYSCSFHETKECKRNMQNKRDEDDIKKLMETKLDLQEGGYTNKTSQKEICKPWYCAFLPVVETKDDANNYGIKTHSSSAELIQKQYIKKDYQIDIYCSQKCYMANLWKYKIKHEKKRVSNFKFLFDHPFPNSFYAKYLNDYFYENSAVNDGWISVESQIVKQSDEIAQRQEDLEDGIRKGLITLDEARKKLQNLVGKISFSFETRKSLNKKIAQAKSPEKIGELIVYFYSNILMESTKYNFDLFANESKQQGKKINIYCLLHLLMKMSNDKKKRKWILRELGAISSHNNEDINLKSKLLNKFFSVNVKIPSFYFIVYDYLDTIPKKEYFYEKDSDPQTENINHKIFVEYIKCLRLNEELHFKRYLKARKEKAYYIQRKAYLEMIDMIREHLKNKYSGTYNDFFLNKKKEDKWKIEYLSLPQFYVLYLIYSKYIQKKCKIFCIKDLPIINSDDYTKGQLYDPTVHFDTWKNINKIEANRVLANIVDFVKDHASSDKKREALKEFNDETGKIILKSEIVEKNDGKATFILKRLFKAYINDAHQLPDEGLKNILFLFKENQDAFIKKEQILLDKILQKLRKTLPNDEHKTNMIIKNIRKKKDFHKIRAATIKKLKDNTSNEIRAFLDSRMKLYDFIKEYILKNKHFNLSHKNEFLKSYPKQQSVLKEFRRVMNNPILNATPLWKMILTRGICDYIASLTDQEAIDEYEKLYAGVMEIV